jgi:hypothetical protein
MSRENVELVRAAWDAWGRGDLDAVFATYHHDIEWDTTHFEGWPETGVYRGHDGVRKFFDDWLATWDRYEVRLEEAIEVGERVLTLYWQRGVGRGGGVPMEFRGAQVIEFRDGKIAVIDNYSDHAKALEAVGLRD